MNRIFWYFLALVLLSAVAYVVVMYGPKAPASPAGSSSTGTEMTVRSVHEDTAAYIVSAEYPQFGIPNVDARVKAAVDAAVSDFETLPPNPPDSATPQNQFTGAFDAVYAGPDVVSVELILSEYTGGAHDNTVIQAVNVNRQTGKELTLDDALAMTGLTLQQISGGAVTQLQSTLGTVAFPDGAAPTADNYGTFLVSADKITFVFQDYQVAPYSDGPQEVEFARVK